MHKLITTGAALLAVAGVSGGTAVAATPATTGSVKVTLTSPRAYEGQTRTANITCATPGSAYVIRFGRTGRDGSATVAGALSIRAYAGPGSYTGRLTVAATGPRGKAGATRAAVPVTITATGGEAAFSRTLKGERFPKLAGKTLAGTVAWTCAA